MKKSLLIASMAVAAASSAFAVTDGISYETINGFTCVNKWIDDRIHNLAGWEALPINEYPLKARTACLATIDGKDVVIIGYSKTMTVGEESNDFAHLVLIDFVTGEPISTIQMTCDGEPIKGLLCANQVGCDQFGHVWFAGYVEPNYNPETGVFKPIRIYMVDDWATGACSLQAELTIPEDETEAVARYDYYDLVGDVTRQEARCTVMVASTQSTEGYGEAYVGGWMADQGSDKWEGAMDGYTTALITETYPADMTTWGTGPMVRIVLDDDYTNSLFYVDGFTTCPTLYNNSGAMLDSFAAAPDLAPKTGTNGVGEFTLGGTNFLAYSIEQYDSGATCRARIAQLGQDQAFEGMESYWLIPENGLGDVSDGGNRLHVLETKVYTDNAGKQGAYVLTYKCNNGLGVYAIAEEGWVDPNSGDNAVNDIVADTNVPVKYYNLNGVEMNGNLTPGLYITRQGDNVNKVIVK